MGKHQHIKDSMRSEEELPPHLSWEAMGPSIMEQLDEPKSRRRLFWIPVLAGMLIVCICFLTYLNYHTEKTPEITPNTPITKAQSSLNEKPITKSTTKPQSQVTSEPNTSTHSDVLTQETMYKKTAPFDNTTMYSNQINIGAMTNSIADLIVTPKSALSDTSSHFSNTIVKNNIALVKDRPQLFQKITGDEITLDFIETLSFNLETPTYELAMTPDGIDSEDNMTTIPAIGLELFGLTNYWFGSYSNSSLDQKRKEAESAIPSYSFGGNIHCDITDKWRLTTGVKYQKLESKFYFFGHRHTIIPTAVNINTINIFTGSAEPHNVLRSVNGLASREVLHYNSYQSVSIPLLISRKWKTNNLTLSTGLGIEYGFSRRNTGKTLMNSSNGYPDVNVFEIQESEIYTTSSTLGLVGNIALSYMLSDNMSLGLELGGNQSLTNYNIDKNHSFKPTVIQGGLNIGYWF